MKYYKRLGIYKAGNVEFNPETMQATSYRHWLFVNKIKGKVVFNDYRYSMSTGRHQRKVEEVLNELGIKIHLYVSNRRSLSDFTFSFIPDLYYKIGWNIAEIKHGNVRQKTKDQIKLSNQYLKEQIKQMRKLGAVCSRSTMNEKIKSGKVAFLGDKKLREAEKEEKKEKLRILTEKVFKELTTSATF